MSGGSYSYAYAKIVTITCYSCGALLALWDEAPLLTRLRIVCDFEGRHRRCEPCRSAYPHRLRLLPKETP